MLSVYSYSLFFVFLFLFVYLFTYQFIYLHFLYRNIVGLAIGYSKAIVVDMGFCLQVRNKDYYYDDNNYDNNYDDDEKQKMGQI